MAGDYWAPRIAGYVCAAHYLAHALRLPPGPLLLVDSAAGIAFAILEAPSKAGQLPRIAGYVCAACYLAHALRLFAGPLLLVDSASGTALWTSDNWADVLELQAEHSAQLATCAQRTTWRTLFVCRQGPCCSSIQLQVWPCPP